MNVLVTFLTPVLLESLLAVTNAAAEHLWV
jgi:hypothetical protein